MNERTTPETDELDCELHNPRVIQDRYSEMLEHARRMERERDEARSESLEQARLLGISGERECRLIAERDELLVELEEYRSIAENIGAKKAVSEKEKAIRSRDEAIQKYDTLVVENMLEVNKICNQRDEAVDALMKIEDIFIDGDDTYEDWKSMGQIARTFFEKTYESGTNQNN